MDRATSLIKSEPVLTTSENSNAINSYGITVLIVSLEHIKYNIKVLKSIVGESTRQPPS